MLCNIMINEVELLLRIKQKQMYVIKLKKINL